MIIRRLPPRWQVTGAFAGVLVLVLLAVGGFVWWRMSSGVDQALDRGLRARATEVGALVDQPGLALFPPGGPTLEADEKVAQILHADGTWSRPAPSPESGSSTRPDCTRPSRAL